MIMSFLISAGGMSARGRAVGVLEPLKFEISLKTATSEIPTRVCSGRALPKSCQ